MRYPEPNLNIVSWQQAEVSLRQIREQVFMQEQSVPAELEWDGLDAEAKHLLLNIGQQPVACARLLPTQHLGRMAVLPEWRGKGLGRRLMQCAIDYATSRMARYSYIRTNSSPRFLSTIWFYRHK